MFHGVGFRFFVGCGVFFGDGVLFFYRRATGCTVFSERDVGILPSVIPEVREKRWIIAEIPIKYIMNLP